MASGALAGTRNRIVTERVGALDDRFLARDHLARCDATARHLAVPQPWRHTDQPVCDLCDQWYQWFGQKGAATGGRRMRSFAASGLV